MKLKKVIEVDKEKCINCHSCISSCPVKYCNNGSGDHVTINEDLCIGCGECLRACTHEARIIIDDFDIFMKAIRNREKIVAVVAPAIAAEFPETYLNFNGWLKSIGVSAMFDVSFGAELTIKTYLDHVATNKPKAVISQPCPAIVSYIEIFQPELLNYLAPADSPMMHTIKLIKNYYPQFSGHKVLIVSPCIAKKREFDEVGLGDYNVTMKKFKEYLKNERINLSQYPQTEFDNDPAERAVLFSTPGGLLRTAQRENPDIVNVARKIEGPEIIYEYLSHLEKDINRGIAPLLIDCLNCAHGCNGGTGTSKDKSLDEIEKSVEKRNIEMQEAYNSKNIFKSKKLAHRKIQATVNKYWKANLYGRTYNDLSGSNFKTMVKIPSSTEVEKIYKELLKENESDILNCGGCGYNECKNMATAIYNGLNKKENCHLYEKKYFSGSVHEMLDEMKKFSNGDLTVELHIANDDEVGKFYAEFNKALEGIRNLLSSLVGLINATASTSSQISSSSEEMAAGAAEQSSQTNEVASAIDQMTKTIVATTKNSSSAAMAAKDAGGPDARLALGNAPQRHHHFQRCHDVCRRQHTAPAAGPSVRHSAGYAARYGTSRTHILRASTTSLPHRTVRRLRRICSGVFLVPQNDPPFGGQRHRENRLLAERGGRRQLSGRCSPSACRACPRATGIIRRRSLAPRVPRAGHPTTTSLPTVLSSLRRALCSW